MSVFEETRGLQVWKSVGSPLLIAGLHPTGSSNMQQSILLIYTYLCSQLFCLIKE